MTLSRSGLRVTAPTGNQLRVLPDHDEPPQNFLILPFKALRRTHVLDPTVPMLDVVPMHESGGPSTRCLQVSETLRESVQNSTDT